MTQLAASYNCAVVSKVTDFYMIEWIPNDGSYGGFNVSGSFLWISYIPPEPFLIAVSAVPEPSAIALLAIGALGAGAIIAYRSRHRETQRRQRGS